MSDPHNPGETAVTIKYGKGYDESWVTFRGSVESVRTQISDYFGLEGSSYDNLHDLTLEATALAHGATAAANGAGGRAIPKDDKAGSNTRKDSAGNEEKAEEPKSEEKLPSPLVERIEECTSRTSLKELWAANKAAFDADEDLMTAYRTKGKSLPAE